MKRVYVTEVHQHDAVFYLGKADPRVLVRLADQSIEIGQTQDAQRPLEKKHLQEIAEFVADNTGLLPGAVMVATKNKEKLVILKDESDSPYIDFPETEDEIKDYDNTIDIIDGQHRLFSFSQAYCQMNANEPYEIPFSLFVTPILKTRQLLFTITNEKQKAVSRNLLLYLKSQLNMLTTAEEIYYPLVNMLATENASILQSRIILSAEKISKGYKASELIKIFDKAKINSLEVNGQRLSNELLLTCITTYLKGWESFHGVSFQKPGKDTITKISGLRYILLLLRTFYDHAINAQKRFTEEFVKEVIQDLEDVKGLGPNDTLFTAEQYALNFRSEGATCKMADMDAQALKNFLASKSTGGFNPF